MIKRLAIFGVGLIGGSLALALKKANYCQEVIGCGRTESNLQKAVELGVIDDYTLDPVSAIEGADIVFLATPLRAMGPILKAIAPHFSDETIITDGGSSKATVVEATRLAFGKIPGNFVPGHPIAGREKSGVTAALDHLYRDHKVILTPLESTNAHATQRVKAMWEATGAEVRFLKVAQNDLVLAATSHLPHVVAYSLVDTISRTDYVDEIFQFAAGGFRDCSRTASSDPTMWRDICLENRQAILDCVTAFESNLAGLRKLIEDADAERLLSFFERAKKIRDENVMKSSPLTSNPS